MSDPEREESRDDPSGESFPRWLIVIAGIAVLVFVGVTLLFGAHFGFGLSPERQIWGQFGDYVGGVLNPLLSLFAFLALLYTIHLQRRDLRATLDELKLSRAAQESLVEARQVELELLQRREEQDRLARSAEREPRLELERAFVSPDGCLLTILLINRGAQARDLRLMGVPAQNYSRPNIPEAVRSGGIAEFKLRLKSRPGHAPCPTLSAPLRMTIQYLDGYHEVREIGLVWKGDDRVLVVDAATMREATQP